MLQRAQIKKDDEPAAVRTGVSGDNTVELSGNTSTGTSGNDNEIAINPSPSFDSIRACYEDSVARQRDHESSQYIRTLSDSFTLFLDLSFTILAQTYLTQVLSPPLTRP